MIQLILLCLLFVQQAQPQNEINEYSILTVVEMVGNAGKDCASIISQNGILVTEPLPKVEEPHYIFKSKSHRTTRIKVDSIELTALMGTGSIIPLNYDNIAYNDVLITQKINELAKEGWILAFIAPGVHHPEIGSYFTRYYFRKSN